MNQAISQEPPEPLPTACSPESTPPAPFFPMNCFSLLLPDTPHVTDTHPFLPLLRPSDLDVTIADLLNSVKAPLRAILVPASTSTHFLTAAQAAPGIL